MNVRLINKKEVQLTLVFISLIGTANATCNKSSYKQAKVIGKGISSSMKKDSNYLTTNMASSKVQEMLGKCSSSGIVHSLGALYQKSEMDDNAMDLYKNFLGKNEEPDVGKLKILLGKARIHQRKKEYWQAYSEYVNLLAMPAELFQRLRKKDQDEVRAQKKYYFKEMQKFEFEDNDLTARFLRKEIEGNLHKINPNSRAVVHSSAIDFHNINFNSGNAKLVTASLSELQNIYLKLKDIRFKSLLVVGHTDASPWENLSVKDSQKKNMQLSQQRAEVVKNYFATQGLDASKIRVSGKGSSEPISNNGQDRRVNIDVEF